MKYSNLLCEKKGSNFWITINRADKMNALNIATLREIKEAVEEANADDEVRVILLTGAGLKAFAAGADISEFADFTAVQGTKMAADGHAVMNTIENSRKLVIALINGFALGGGCELAMASHLRIASETARFGQPEVNLGLLPGYGGTQRLCQLVGKGRAMAMLLSGDAIKADEALAIGLVNQVVPLEELHAAGEKMAAKYDEKAPLSLAAIIQCVNDLYSDTADGFETEIHAFGNSFATTDFKEGTQAFLQKRPASFKGN